MSDFVQIESQNKVKAGHSQRNEDKEKQNSKEVKSLLLIICRRNSSRNNIRDKCYFPNQGNIYSPYLLLLIF